MQEKEELIQKQDAEKKRSSVAAVSVAGATFRWLKMNRQRDFSPKEILAMKHVLEKAIDSENNLLFWCAEKLVWNSFFCVQKYAFDQLLFPGYDSTIYTRKLAVRRFLLDRIAVDKDLQVVFLGGGYDLAAFFAAKDCPNPVIEIDLGETQQIKVEALKTLPKGCGDYAVNEFTELGEGDVQIGKNYYNLACDLSSPHLARILAESLGKTVFQQKRRTLFIIEGLTPYLSAEANKRLLKVIYNLVPADSEIFVGYLDSDRNSAAEDWALQSADEDYQFILGLEEIGSFVKPFEVTAILKQPDRILLNGDKKTAQLFASGKQKNEHYVVITKLENPKEEVKPMSEVPDLDL